MTSEKSAATGEIAFGSAAAPCAAAAAPTPVAGAPVLVPVPEQVASSGFPDATAHLVTSEVPDDATPAALQARGDEFVPTPEVARDPRRLVAGVAAFVFAVLFALITIAAIVLQATGHLDQAYIVAVISTGGTAITFVLGLLSVLAGRGRGWGAAAMALSFVANPYLLVTLLESALALSV